MTYDGISTPLKGLTTCVLESGSSVIWPLSTTPKHVTNIMSYRPIF